LPQTGLDDTLTIWVYGLLISLMGFGGLFFALDYLKRKVRREEGAM